MNFSEAFKVFQLNILRQSGVMVTPEQVGLKRDPIAEMQAKSMNGPFANVLGQMGGGANGMAVPGLNPPKLPTPPVDPANAEAQAKYHQELLAYTQNFQLYNQRFMQLMLSRMAQMQQAMLQQNKQTQSSSDAKGSLDQVSAIGGIIDI